MKVNSLQINDQKIYVLEEEIKIFKDIYDDLLNILKKVNPQINFIIINNSFNDFEKDIKILTILPIEDIESKNYYTLFIDRGDMTGRFNFYKEFFENNKFIFNEKLFLKTIEKLRYNWINFSKKKRIKDLDLFSKFSNLRNKIGLSSTKILIKHIKLKYLIKYNYEALNYAFCYKKPKKFEDNFNFVVENLSDDNSKDDYRNFYYGNFKKNLKKFLINHINCIQYSDYISLDSNSVILNCGVRAGFEIPLYLSKNVDKIYSIDPSGSKYLDPYVKKIIKIKNKTEMIFINKALYFTDSVYGVNKDNLKTTTLNDIIKNFNIKRIDLIKSDIEGGERIMVNELINICNKYRPQLALSIYHDNYNKNKFILDDGVDIPKKLILNLKDYNFFYKHYSFDKNEAIFYAMPK